MKIKIIANTSIRGNHVDRGTELDVEKSVANELIGAGKAERVAAAVSPTVAAAIGDVDLSAMNKAKIAAWALENLDVEVSPEQTKDDMIAVVQAEIDKRQD